MCVHLRLYITDSTTVACIHQIWCHTYTPYFILLYGNIIDVLYRDIIMLYHEIAL